MTSISIRGLAKRYPRRADLLHFLRRRGREGHVTALEGIDLELRPGVIYGLVGHNGAGKTTLLKVLAGLVLPTEGEVRVGDIDAVAHPRALRAHVGLVVADERSFFWRIGVEENLRFFASLQGHRGDERRRVVAETLDRVGLAEVADVAFKELSTGQRQRLAIARGMLADPRVLLMDEATRSLDPQGARDVRSFVRDVARERPDRVVVYSSHVLAEVEDLCDEAIVLRGGKVAGQGSPAVTDEGRGTLVVRTRRPAEAGTWRDLEGVVELACGECSRLQVDGPGAAERVAERAVARGLGLLELRREGSPLERWLAAPEEANAS